MGLPRYARNDGYFLLKQVPLRPDPFEYFEFHRCTFNYHFRVSLDPDAAGTCGHL